MTRTRRAAVVGIAIVAGAISAYGHDDSPLTHASGAARTLDPAVVAVLPFAVGDSQPALLDLRDAIQDLVAARLPGGDGAPKAVDPATVRRQLRRATPREDYAPSLDVSLSIAQMLGAGELLYGEVGGTPDEVSLEAVLAGVPGGDVRARASARGHADSLPYLAEQVVARLLAVQAARDSDELSAFNRTSASAFRAYLAGLHAYRRGRTGLNSEATLHFERALFLDSTFALAALRLAQMATFYGTDELDGLWRFDAAWEQRHRLGHADRAVLVAYVGPRYPRPATVSERVVASERAAAAAPNRVEAWRIAALNLLQFGSKIGYPDWDTRALEALKRAHAMDSLDSSIPADLLLLAVRAGDRAAVRRYAGLRSALHPVGQQARFGESLRWLSATALGDSAGLADVRSRFTERVSLRAIVDWSQTFGVGLDDGERAATLFAEGASEGVYHRSVIVAIVPFLLNRGRPGQASRLLATAERGFGQRIDVGVLEFRIHAALYWDGDSTEAAAAARSLEAYLDGAQLPLGQARDPETAACALAHWRFAGRDFRGATAALERMRRLRAASTAYPIESTPVCAAAVEAQLAAAQRWADAPAALEGLDTLLRAGFDVQLLLPTVATVIASRLYEARGDRLHALALTRRRNFWWTQLLSTQIRDEGRLATLIGDTAGAIRAYRHYLALRSDPEPRLRADVERVRTELAALTRR
jgi:hypothetical protein